MRLLILSESIEWDQNNSDNKYVPPHQTYLDVGNPNEVDNFSYSLFDYDVSIIHIRKPNHHTIGYYENIPRFIEDTKIALRNGRTILILPDSKNFRTKRSNKYGPSVYDWLQEFGVELKENYGAAIRPSGIGTSEVFSEYLKNCSDYHQIVSKPEVEELNRIAVVGETEIIIGMEYIVQKGNIVILPPPNLKSSSYQIEMYNIEKVARRYFNKAKRTIPISDSPQWISKYLVEQSINLEKQIQKLKEEKTILDIIAYVLYGTGEELEDSVASIFKQLGLEINMQPDGANIDIIAKYSKLDIGFAVEVTGTKGTIKKDSKKITQAWQHIHDSKGAIDNKERIVIVANTERHLSPVERQKAPFSKNVIELLKNNGVLLLTTVQLFSLWKNYYKGTVEAEEIIKSLFESVGIYKENSND